MIPKIFHYIGIHWNFQIMKYFFNLNFRIECQIFKSYQPEIDVKVYIKIYFLHKIVVNEKLINCLQAIKQNILTQQMAKIPFWIFGEFSIEKRNCTSLMSLKAFRSSTTFVSRSDYLPKQPIIGLFIASCTVLFFTSIDPEKL